MRPGIDLAGKRVLVVGLARTGMVTSLFAAGYGAAVTATDEKSEAELGGETVAKLRAAGVSLMLGGQIPGAFLDQDLIVVSPGVPAHIPGIDLARANHIPVWSEIELAWRFLRGKVIAITGSNGKTTTTSLVAHILKNAGIETLLGGNIGTPLLALVERSTDSSVTVAEISSFQLETVEAFRPEIGVLLNLTPDHLDRHATFDEYAAAKMRMFENQTERDFAVLNADDPAVTGRMPAKPHIFWFSRLKRVAAGAYVRDDQIFFRNEGSETAVARCDEIPLLGQHNVENVLAACAAAYLAGAIPSAIGAGVRTFKAVEHRLEFVAEIGGVKFYNDSKATNVDATLKAIEAFSGPLFVILGGKDKGSDYIPLREPLRARAGKALLVGAAADKIAEHLGDAIPIERSGTIERAVQAAIAGAKPGDVVLLTPACASFDQFENYEHRGRVFKEIVARAAAESAAAEDSGAGGSAKKRG
ncbi:MAG: UDP-N-acetylmuramoyl-L-alanine--D-glutamate ligase [Candidatus Acidiferrales bacterium]